MTFTDPMTQASETGATSTDWNDVVSRPLPPGVHPDDQAEIVSSDFGTNSPVPPDRSRPAQPLTGRPPYSVENFQAIPVYQRASDDGDVRIVQVNANNGGTAIACNRQRGRQRVTLSVPSLLPDGVTVPNGVIWGFQEGDVQGAGNGSCGILNPGDSVTIATEAPIYLGLIANKASGAAQVLTETNIAGGGLDL